MTWLENAKKIGREITNGDGFTYNGKKANYAFAGKNDYMQDVFILGYDDIREARCFADSGYSPYITANKEIKFLKK